MAEPKDTTSFFRKVVKFVANPATDWAELDAPGRGHSRERLRQGRAEGDDRAQAAQRLRPQARVRHAAQGAPRGPVQRTARGARRLLAPRRLGAARLGGSRPARTPASRPRSTRSSSRWSATATPDAAPRPGVLQRADRSRRRSTCRRPRPRGERADAAAPGRPGRAISCRRPSRAGTDRQAAVPAAAPPARSPRSSSTSRPPAAFGQAFAAAASHRGRPRPRARRGRDRLRQCRFRAVRAGAVGADRPRRRAAPSMPRPGWCCSTSTARSASSTSSRAWRSTTPSSSAGRRRNGSRCRSWSPRRPARSGRAARAAIEGQVGWVCPE